MADCLTQLRTCGLLLLQDRELPNIARLIAGGPIAGSWWGSPQAGGTYAVMRALEDHPEVLTTKLVSGKVTYVHQRLWPAVLAVATARQSWQVEGLSGAAKQLLDWVDRQGEVQLDSVPLPASVTRKDLNDAARHLERRLLALGSEVHTPSGAHAKVLQAWERWASGAGFREPLPGADEARLRLEESLLDLSSSGGSARLPWQT